MITLIAAFFGWFVSASDAQALQRTAPEPITFEFAVENLAAARVAGAAFRVDPDLLLAVAAHESRYAASAVTQEPHGLVSCGVMTPEPVASCKPQTVLDGYLAGAKHLRAWMDAKRDLEQALIGYAGGYALISACAAGPVLRKTGRHDDLCSIGKVFLWRRDWIRRERRRVLIA